MKHVLIIGASNSGKSSTIKTLVRKLSPSKVYRIKVAAATKKEVSMGSSSFNGNGTCVVEVGGKLILVAMGAPTEQNFCITKIMKAVEAIFGKGAIAFAVVAMRTREREGFSTKDELKTISECVLEERIYRIKDTTTETLSTNPEFIERVEKMYKVVKENL